MNIFSRVVVITCVLIFIAAGFMLVALAWGKIGVGEISLTLEYLIQDSYSRWITGIGGVVLMLIGAFILQTLLGNLQRERTIAFNNPDGEVTISLSAIEDFLKKISHQIPEVRELKPLVIAGRQGVEVSVRVALWADVSIPDATEKIQTLIKRRIQEMLRIEEEITIKVHVGKVVEREKAREKKKEEETEEIYRGPRY